MPFKIDFFCNPVIKFETPIKRIISIFRLVLSRSSYQNSSILNKKLSTLCWTRRKSLIDVFKIMQHLCVISCEHIRINNVVYSF